VPTTYVLDTDYELDTVNSRWSPIVGGGIANGTDITVDYTPESNSRMRMKTTENKVKRGALTIIEINPKGENKRWWIPKVTVMADGAMGLQDRANPREISLKFSVGTRDGYEQVYADGAAA